MNQFAPRHSVLSGRLRGLASNTRGQVSFSVIAVVILVSSAVAGTYFAKNQMDQAENARKQEMLGAMELAVNNVVNELSICAAGRAQSTMSGWSEFPINESKISEAFSGQMLSYISTSFPRTSDKFFVEVRNWTGGLFFVERNTLDLVSDVATSTGNFSADGEEMQYDKLPRASSEVLGVKTMNPYYVAVGNFSVKVASKGVALTRQTSFQRPVISALPFLESKLRAFEAASSGECSDLGSLVGSMLSTLAELRVLEGYGQPMYSGGKNSSEIVTESDVYRAVCVGLLLEQLRLFRTVDRDFASSVEQVCGGLGPGMMAIEGSKGRSLDPAELFLWFLGKTEPELDPAIILAESIFGLADQMVLKFMDYMGWLGTLDLAKDLLDKVTSSIDSIVSYLTGEDKAKVAVVSWIRKSLSLSSSDPFSSSLIFSSKSDCVVPVREKMYYVQNAYGELYPVWVGNVSAMVDVPEYDLLASETWKEFYPEFKDHQASFRRLATDSVARLAFDIASAACMELSGFVIDPSDGKDLFTQLALSAGKVDLVLDPVEIARAGKKLPMFSAQYDLSSSFTEFVASERLDLIEMPYLTRGGYDNLTAVVLDSARYPYIPNLVVPVEQQLAEIVRHDVEFDSEWNVGNCLVSGLENILGMHLDGMARLINRSVLRADDGFAGPMVDAVASMMAFGAGSFPGLEPMIEECLGQLARDVISQGELTGHKQSVYLDNRGSFEFWDGDRNAAVENGRLLEESVVLKVTNGLPGMRTVPYDASKGYSSLEHLFPADELLIQLRRPWDFSRSSEDYPNIHLTAIGNVSTTPYSTQWTVSVIGMIELKVRSNNSEFQSLFSDGAASERAIRIELSLPIVVQSAWPLQGVEYNPSNTLLSDGIEAAKKFCDIVWDKLKPVVGWIKDGLERIYRFVQNAIEVLCSFATKIVKLISSALQTVVETLQKFVQKIADSVLGKAVRTFIDLTGRVEFRISLFGFVIIVQTNLPDLIYRHGSDLLRVMVYTDRFGPGITFGVRVARLTDGSYDILANGTIALKNTVIEVAVDPLMHILRRFVEVHCTGRSWALDLVIPEVEPYELAEVSTADIPGVGAFLSNIPVPVLGLSAAIEAGMRLKYASPFPTNIVVNEFESNPQGEDSGKEWVELYNPLGKPKSVDGWMLGTVHGKSTAIKLEGTIPANGVEVFTFPDTAIDNGYADDPFNDGDAIVLTDPAGVTIDITPMLKDTANDARTNQRSWDGGPKWVFRQGTRDNSNGLPVMLASSDFIAKALFEAFKEAFMETKLEEVSASLDFVTLFAKRVLNNFIENLLSLVQEIIHEVIFFIKVALSDASGTAGVGFRASFVVTGEAIVDLLRRLIHSFATFVVNLGRASHPIAYPAFPQHFFSGLYLRFEALFEVGLPKMVRLVGAVGDIKDKFSCVVSISPNIPALGKLAGKHWGNWSVDFGVYLEGVPKEFAANFLTKDTGKLIDFWIVKARVYGV